MTETPENKAAKAVVRIQKAAIAGQLQGRSITAETDIREAFRAKAERDVLKRALALLAARMPGCPCGDYGDGGWDPEACVYPAAYDPPNCYPKGNQASACWQEMALREAAKGAEDRG